MDVVDRTVREFAGVVEFGRLASFARPTWHSMSHRKFTRTADGMYAAMQVPDEAQGYVRVPLPKQTVFSSFTTYHENYKV